MLTLIDCERERTRDAQIADIDRGIAERESVPWDWADYEALATLASFYATIQDDPTPVARALIECRWNLEEEHFRAGVADSIRRITQ
jgi:hypothetical protein